MADAAESFEADLPPGVQEPEEVPEELAAGFEVITAAVDGADSGADVQNTDGDEPAEAATSAVAGSGGEECC